MSGKRSGDSGAGYPSKTEWKQFEETVGRLEMMLDKLGGKVTINDRIPDKYGGKPRQIDATLRYSTGTTDMLIMFECRKRSRVSDKTWVEQVSTKRNNLRADKAILVSNKPLAEDARRMANDLGIEVRTLMDLSDPSNGSAPTFMYFCKAGWDSVVSVGVLRGPEYDSRMELLKKWDSSAWSGVVLTKHGQRLGELPVLIAQIMEGAPECPKCPPGTAIGPTYKHDIVAGEDAELSFHGDVIPIVYLGLFITWKVDRVATATARHASYTNDSGKVNHTVSEMYDPRFPDADPIRIVRNADGSLVTFNLPSEFFDKGVVDPSMHEHGAFVDVTFEEGKPNLRTRNVPGGSG